MVAWIALGLVLALYGLIAAGVVVVLNSPMAKAHRQARKLARGLGARVVTVEQYAVPPDPQEAAERLARPGEEE